VWIIVSTINMHVFVTVLRMVNSQGEKQHTLFMINATSVVQSAASKLMVTLRVESAPGYITNKTELAAS
jgi:hypothetical protein